jgi:hypothetical protein
LVPDSGPDRSSGSWGRWDQRPLGTGRGRHLGGHRAASPSGGRGGGTGRPALRGRCGGRVLSCVQVLSCGLELCAGRWRRRTFDLGGRVRVRRLTSNLGAAEVRYVPPSYRFAGLRKDDCGRSGYSRGWRCPTVHRGHP